MTAGESHSRSRKPSRAGAGAGRGVDHAVALLADVTATGLLQHAGARAPRASDWLICVLVASSVLWLRELSKVAQRGIRLHEP